MKASEAQKRANKKWYEKAKETVLARHRKYSRTKRGKEIQAKKDKVSQKKHPERWAARNAVWRARRDEKLFKPAFCDNAGCMNQTRLQAHHYLGYKKEHWLDVIYLCPKHHIEADKNIYENPELLNKEE